MTWKLTNRGREEWVTVVVARLPQARRCKMTRVGKVPEVGFVCSNPILSRKIKAPPSQ